jgi:hypothetical protein
MTTKRAPWIGIVTALELLSRDEIQRRVSVATGKSTFVWPPPLLLPMLPNEGTEKLVSDFSF